MRVRFNFFAFSPTSRRKSSIQFGVVDTSANVKNVYNRLVFIDGKTWHAPQTFGTKERLTLCFFATRIDGKTQPMFRY